jgi:hypothetical protein
MNEQEQQDPFGAQSLEDIIATQKYRRELRDKMREESQRLLREKYGDGTDYSRDS